VKGLEKNMGVRGGDAMEGFAKGFAVGVAEDGEGAGAVFAREVGHAAQQGEVFFGVGDVNDHQIGIGFTQQFQGLVGAFGSGDVMAEIAQELAGPGFGCGKTGRNDNRSESPTILSCHAIILPN